MSDHLTTIEDVYPKTFRQHAKIMALEPPHRWAAIIQSIANMKPVPDALETVPRLHAKAYVNNGRWVIDCPAQGCGGAQLASLSDHRYLCHECGNVLTQGHPVPVIWPDDAMRQEIETLLMRRPTEGKRNWFTYESVEDLDDENHAHREQMGD